MPLVGIEDLSVVKMVTLKRWWGVTIRPENLGGYGKGLWPANSNNTDTPYTDRGGYGNYGVIVYTHISIRPQRVLTFLGRYDNPSEKTLTVTFSSKFGIVLEREVDDSTLKRVKGTGAYRGTFRFCFFA